MKTIGSLFSGTGALDLAAEDVLDAYTIWHAENDPAASAILARRWQGIPNHGDITAVDWSTVQPVDILTAGYPCQPESDAGRKLSNDDPRWLFPEVARAISVLRPRFVVLENVRGHLVRGFPAVLGTLTGLGYDTQWTLIRASDVGAPHRRERLFALAWPATNTRGETVGLGAGLRAGRTVGQWGRRFDDDRVSFPVADLAGWGQYGSTIRHWERVLGRPAPPAIEYGPRIGQRLSARFVEWLMGLPAGWVTDTPGISYPDQLKALGNAVVWQQAAAALRHLLTTANIEDAA